MTLPKQERLPQLLEHQGRLVRFKGNYYLRVPVTIQRQARTPGLPKRVCAVDPAVRTPWLVWDDHGNVTDLGADDFKHLAARAILAGQIQSKIDRSYGPYADEG